MAREASARAVRQDRQTVVLRVVSMPFARVPGGQPRSRTVTRTGRSRYMTALYQPALVRTRHLPLLLARGKSPPQSRLPVRSNAEAQSPAGAAHPAHRCPSRDAYLGPAQGTQHSAARPAPTRQNSRFWMSATSRTVIVRGVPNGGSRAPYPHPAVTVRDVAGVPPCADRSRQGEHGGGDHWTGVPAKPGSPPMTSGTHGRANAYKGEQMTGPEHYLLSPRTSQQP